MTPALESSRDLLEWLLERLTIHSRHAGALAAEFDDNAGDSFWLLGADLAALIPVVEVLLDRDRFPTK
jgi:hypothetical protein